MNPRIKVVSRSYGKLSERECEVLYKDHRLLIVHPIPNEFNELLVFYAQRQTHGFQVLIPGDSIRVNLCEVGIPKVSGRYKLADDGSASIEIDPIGHATTHKAVIRPSERKGLGGKRSS